MKFRQQANIKGNLNVSKVFFIFIFFFNYFFLQINFKTTQTYVKEIIIFLLICSLKYQESFSMCI